MSMSPSICKQYIGHCWELYWVPIQSEFPYNDLRTFSDVAMRKCRHCNLTQRKSEVWKEERNHGN